MSVGITIKENEKGIFMKYYLAIDLGASSGRHIIGYKENGEIKLKEVYRFKNAMVSVGDRLVWDVEKIFNEIKNGIRFAISSYGKIESLAIDTWGVDYVLLDGDKEILPCYAYRDAERGLVAPKVHEIIDFSTLYSRTGIEFNTFNTIYGLYAEKLNGRLDKATDFLLLPEYFTYKLTGVKAKEYTMCTTTGLVNATTHEFDSEIIDKLGLKKQLFGKIYQAGHIVGGFTEQVKGEVGGDIPVMLCASHDTASAVVAIDMDENSPYISSGTWSLFGIKTDKAITDKGESMSNEGGINNTFRHQKNIMGMWLINNLKDCLSEKLTFDEMEQKAKESSYKEIFDVNDDRFFAPENMKNAILSYLSEYGKPMPKTEGDIISSVYHSLAYGYAKTCELIENNTSKTYDKIYIVGGGAKNVYLNDLTSLYSGKRVIALPIEATALGNLKIQMSK